MCCHISYFDNHFNQLALYYGIHLMNRKRRSRKEGRTSEADALLNKNVKVDEKRFPKTEEHYSSNVQCVQDISSYTCTHTYP